MIIKSAVDVWPPGFEAITVKGGPDPYTTTINLYPGGHTWKDHSKWVYFSPNGR